MNSSQVLRERLVGHYPQIRRIVQRIAKNEGIVDDIAQECCVRIIEKENLWDGNDKKLNQWINTVTRNLAFNFVSRKKEDLPLEQEPVVIPEEKEFSPEHVQWVLQQFRTLSEMQKKVLQMKYFEGMKLAEIAKELNISCQAVSTHLSRALKHLKKRARTQGFLATLLPWNWDSIHLETSNWISGIVAVKTKIVAISGVVTTLFLSYSYVQHQDEIEKLNKAIVMLKENSSQFQKDRLNWESDREKMQEDIKRKNIELSSVQGYESEIALLKERLSSLTNKKVSIKSDKPPSNVNSYVKKVAILTNMASSKLKNKLMNPNYLESIAVTVKKHYETAFSKLELDESQLNIVADAIVERQVDMLNLIYRTMLMEEPYLILKEQDEVLNKYDHALTQVLSVNEIDQFEKYSKQIDESEYKEGVKEKLRDLKLQNFQLEEIFERMSGHRKLKLHHSSRIPYKDVDLQIDQSEILSLQNDLSSDQWYRFFVTPKYFIDSNIYNEIEAILDSEQVEKLKMIMADDLKIYNRNKKKMLSFVESIQQSFE